MESVEAAGKSIEDAILQALARLGRNRDEVDIVVLQEPSRGTRGMGAREARVRVFVKAPRGTRGGAGVVTPDMADALLPEEESGMLPEPYAEEEGFPGEGGYEEYPEIVDEETGEIITGALRDIVPEDATIEEVAVTALSAILAHMGVRAAVEVVETENEEEPVTLNIHSDATTLSLLIGRRGETLAALQLLVSLMVSKQTGTREHIIVDAENYRQRREYNLRSMAQRVADQVRHSGRPVALEAMSPAERRIIHMELSAADDISTESTGEGDQRRVVVSLKHPARA